MKKRICSWLLCLVLILPLVTVPAYADCAPKPSIHVKTESEETVKVAILSMYKESGPNEVFLPGEEPPGWWHYEEDTWNEFLDAVDRAEAYFCGHMGQDSVSWKYMCPNRFRIAIYCPEYETVLVSQEIFETYAFRSDFALDLSGLDLTESGVISMPMRKQVEYGKLIGGFLLRAALTLVIELAVAFLFGYREKKYIRFIFFVNLVTQVGLNALLSLWYFADGPLDALLRLILAEIMVLITESILYARRLKGERKDATRAVFYALAANLASVIIGWHMID
ncbi:MAG: hypothetical protein IKC09_06660 [Oscillospiraceae bacterium]|nr:hypothetical protein [Oscillospiraceae bacterium]MBR2889936.1 hypothetical protein [Oscillospiraceae bacterium]